MTILVCWGGIVGVNWSYGSLFGIIFSEQRLSEKEIALIGLAANISTAVFSNLGTFLHNRFVIQSYKVISYLNILGLIAAVLIQYSKYIPALQELWVLVVLIVIMRAGYSSFVSLAFIEMEESGLSSVIISGAFFWIANLINLFGMEILDFLSTDISMFALTLTVGICIYAVSESYIKRTA